MPRSTTNARYRCESSMAGDELRRLRKEHRYSARQLGQAWGISTTTVLTWERGEDPMPCWVDRAARETFAAPRGRPKAAGLVARGKPE